jgi:hypothetical protein
MESLLTTIALSESVAKSAKYLVTEDDGTTHLPYTDEDGNIDHGRMGAAWAALHGGYRGSKYAGPKKAQALAKLRALYESEGMPLPSEKVDKGGPGSGPPPGGLFGAPSPLKDLPQHHHAQARHIETGKWVPGKDGEATNQAHSATLLARTASEQAQLQKPGQPERHTVAATAHTKAKAAHERAALASDKANRPAMAAFHRQAADHHSAAAQTHITIAGMYSQTGA